MKHVRFGKLWTEWPVQWLETGSILDDWGGGVRVPVGSSILTSPSHPASYSMATGGLVTLEWSGWAAKLVTHLQLVLRSRRRAGLHIPRSHTSSLVTLPYLTSTKLISWKPTGTNNYSFIFPYFPWDNMIGAPIWQSSGHGSQTNNACPLHTTAHQHRYIPTLSLSDFNWREWGVCSG
jgi:hypothetical protein